MVRFGQKTPPFYRAFLRPLGFVVRIAAAEPGKMDPFTITFFAMSTAGKRPWANAKYKHH
jgi:hypothetical protein